MHDRCGYRQTGQQDFHCTAQRQSISSHCRIRVGPRQVPAALVGYAVRSAACAAYGPHSLSGLGSAFVLDNAIWLAMYVTSLSTGSVWSPMHESPITLGSVYVSSTTSGGAKLAYCKFVCALVNLFAVTCSSSSC